jgi:hypothetical protein
LVGNGKKSTANRGGMKLIANAVTVLTLIRPAVV